MSGKIAIITHLSEHQECTSCHCFSENGYILRDSNMARFVCENCYEMNESSDYFLARKIVEIKKNIINQIAPATEKVGFHAGYLMGRRINSDVGYRVVVEKIVDSIQYGKGTVNFFNKEDVINIKKISNSEGLALVGIFRTSPSGTPDFNLLDNKTINDMLMEILYMIIGGNNEIQIAARDKNSQSDEIGVILI